MFALLQLQALWDRGCIFFYYTFLLDTEGDVGPLINMKSRWYERAHEKYFYKE